MSRRIIVAVVGGAVLMLGVAACGGASRSADEPTSDEPTSEGIDALYDSCAATAEAGLAALLEQDTGIYNPDTFTPEELLEDHVDSALRFYTTEGESISIEKAFMQLGHDFGPMDSDYLDFAAECLLSESGAPQRVTQHVQSTRALDGQQTDSWDDYEARWSYHPDDGMSLTIWEAA